MKSAVSLYEFMPYGAPELIESRQRHLARALVLTSATSVVLCALTGGLASLIHVPPAELHVAVGNVDLIDIAPPPLAPPAPSIPRIPIRRTAPHPAVPVPVPEAVEPGEMAPPVGPSVGSDTGTDRLNDGTEVGTRTGDQTLPPPDTNVYVEELPSVVKEVKPDYPWIAQQAGIEGLVLVRVLVGVNGRVLDVRLSEKLQVPALNDAALAAARKWVFTPGLANGRPVACWTAIPFRFRLH
jgi:TonB family protein